MKVYIKSIVLLIGTLLILNGCSDNQKVEVKESQTVMKRGLPADTPTYITEKNFKNIDWDKTVTTFNTGETEVNGNKTKLGFIGPDLKVNQVEKWLWHFWGIKNGKVTVVGFHKDTKAIQKVFFDSDSRATQWSHGTLGGATNGADATMPSNVILPKADQWATLVYINEKLFDTLVIDVKE
ncbi:DUF4871 domain-containing protein [Bacillus sp. DX4.1]|uniref:DUF4871 domain-containing protein n=1 Tax=Bacillus sp. DX4.1 TaxID=3055867 RepID=UPI0025A1D0B9|nr:DUF4871 domain-containing protein [Bacillus sp. DX4.1]MDM5190698.1 DUF4871 domain-containing protein [Bacillus sp. DX4.1]